MSVNVRKFKRLDNQQQSPDEGNVQRLVSPVIRHTLQVMVVEAVRGMII